MESIHIMKKQDHCNLPTPPLAVHKDSQTISKVKPKIRIIHIFAPEIIKTDAENFRELVQRLTGKPTEKALKKKAARQSRGGQREHPQILNLSDNQTVTKKLEAINGYGSYGPRERGIKEEDHELMWNGATSGGFLNGLPEMDGFIQELGEFPLLPMVVDANHLQFHGFEESQLS